MEEEIRNFSMSQAEFNTTMMRSTEKDKRTESPVSSSFREQTVAFKGRSRDLKWLYSVEDNAIETRFETFNDIPNNNSKYAKSAYESKLVDMKKGLGR